MKKLWDKNFTLVTVASMLGSLGAIASSFALSYLVFDETKSTLASALVIAIQLIPYIVLPLVISPIMDRMPRKRFLVLGDACNSIAYVLLGLYLLNCKFSYIHYLFISLLLACISSIDELAYTSIYPLLIPKDEKQKGYAVSTMLYPVMKVLMTPLSAILLEHFGIPVLLFIQAGCSLLATITENQIDLIEDNNFKKESYSFKVWKEDIIEGYRYLKKEKGLLWLYSYSAVTNSVSTGYAPLLIAFFTTTTGFTLTMYSFFSVVEFVGRTFASITQYKINIPPKKKFFITSCMHIFYELSDAMLLFLSYPLMLLNRTLCGYVGTNTAIIRTACIQQYIPENLRSRINAFSTILITATSSVFTLILGYLGEFLEYRYCMMIAGLTSLSSFIFFVIMHKKDVNKIYTIETE